MSTVSDKERAKEWIRQNKHLLVELTQNLVRIPSVSGEEGEVQEFIAKTLSELELEPKLVVPDVDILRKSPDFFETTSYARVGYEGRPNVVGVLRGQDGGRSICLSGHVDVVSAEPIENWSRDPWGGEVEGDLLYGRGAGDMKGGIAAMITAVQSIRECGIKLQGDVIIETTIEEEDGGIGGNLFLRLTEPRADAALIPESSNLQIGVASSGVMYFRVTVPGVSAHAATAHFGVNAIHKMIPVVEALKELNEERQRTIAYEYAEASDPRMRGRVTTINPGVIRAGDWPSTVPGACVLECRVGWPPGETREEVKDQIERTISAVSDNDDWLKENPPEVEWFGWYARPHEQDVKHPFIQCLKDNITAVSGKEPIYGGGSAGLDTRFFAHHGIPAAVCGPSAERIHSHDECVSIDSLVKLAEVIASTLIEWCGVE
ncbi:MAG: ArgE/DapE family deacylase [Promethearchaeota archaeon]